MTDEEIKKALECCIEKHCTECPIAKESLCMHNLREHALDLINRQQAEIEKWKAEYTRACAERDARICTQDYFKSEAIKECVDKYTEMLIDEYHLRTDLQIASIKRLEQKVMTEMVGGENA